MSASQHIQFEPAGFFVARTPILAADDAAQVYTNVALAHPIIREAIAYASPSLLEQATEPGRNHDKALPALNRYLARMTGRPTPFGLMAGYTYGPVGGSAVNVELPPLDACLRIIRLDVDCVARIVDRWAKDPA